MAQHIPIKRKDEPRIFASAQKIGKLARVMRHCGMLEEFKQKEINAKFVSLLSKDYCQGTPSSVMALAIGNYKMQGKDWADEPYVKDKAGVEAHFNSRGNIVKIYVVA